MTGKQLVYEAIHHRPTAATPYFVECDPGVAQQLAKHFGCENFDDFLDNSVVWSSLYPLPAPDRDGAAVDEYGVGWDGVGDSRGQARLHPLAEPSLRNYQFPKPDAADFSARVLREISRNQSRFYIAKLGDLFERACYLRGMPEFMMDCLDAPEFVEELLDGILTTLLARLDAARGLPIDALSLSDDYGSQRGLMLSLPMWRRFFLPRLRVLFTKIRQAGFHAVLHSDGAIADLLPDLAQTDLEILHPIQPECVDRAEVTHRFGRRFTLFGGMAGQSLLSFGPPDAIRRELEACLHTMKPPAGFILAPGLGLRPEASLASAAALIDAIRLHCRQ